VEVDLPTSRTDFWLEAAPLNVFMGVTKGESNHHFRLSFLVKLVDKCWFPNRVFISR
jgi:hypothetical protein